MAVTHAEPEALRQANPAVPRDLETICRKCLAKAPAQRCRTADALADDLRAFLEGRPIAARPTRAWEQAAGCRATAELFEKLNRPEADQLYLAARLRAVAAEVATHAVSPDDATADADRAMAWLTKAVAAGHGGRNALPSTTSPYCGTGPTTGHCGGDAGAEGAVT